MIIFFAIVIASLIGLFVSIDERNLLTSTLNIIGYSLLAIIFSLIISFAVLACVPTKLIPEDKYELVPIGEEYVNSHYNGLSNLFIYEFIYTDKDNKIIMEERSSNHIQFIYTDIEKPYVVKYNIKYREPIRGIIGNNICRILESDTRSCFTIYLPKGEF